MNVIMKSIPNTIVLVKSSFSIMLRRVFLGWTSTFCFCLFDSLRPTNNLSVKQGWVLLGWTSTKQGLMCLAHRAAASIRVLGYSRI